MITLRFLARAQFASAIFFAVVGVCLFVCKRFYKPIICNRCSDNCHTIEHWNQREIEVSCLNSSNYRDSTETLEIDTYNSIYDNIVSDSITTALGYYILWALWKHWRPANGVGSDYLQDAMTKSSFTGMTTMAYLLLSWYQLYGPAADSTTGKFPKTSFARLVNCEIVKDGWNMWSPLYVSTTCELPLNQVFRIAYLVIRHWEFHSKVIFHIAQIRIVLLRNISGLRAYRLSMLLKGLDKQRINEIAEDSDAFFKIESCAAEVELKHREAMSRLND